MAIAVSIVASGGSRDSRDMLVACPSTVPVGALLVLLESVRTLNSPGGVDLDHAVQTPFGWTYTTHRNNYDATSWDNDVKQLWAFQKIKAAGDEAWVFRSSMQSPARTWTLLAITGADSATPVASSAIGGSQSNTTSHTFPSVTIDNIGDVHLAVTTQHFEEFSAYPYGYGHLGSQRQRGDSPRVFEADISVWSKVATATGATGTIAYTVGSSDDYCSLSLEIKVGSSAKTATGVTFGSYSVPRRAATPRLLVAAQPTDDAFARAITDGKNMPVLLAELEPLENDSPSAEAGDEKFSSAFYSREYLPAISGIPTIDKVVSSENKIGGRQAQTVGEMILANDRALAPGVDG